MRVSLDAGVLASAFVAPGSADEATYRLALEGEVPLVTSAKVLLEFARLLVDRLGWDPVMAEHAVTHVARVAAAVVPRSGATA